MKRAKISLILCLVLLFNLVFAGCGSGDLSADLSKYTIVTPQQATDYEQHAAEYIRDEILERTDVKVSIVGDNTKKSRNEILVGNTNRELSKQTAKTETEGLEFVINADNKGVALYGDHFVIAAAAYYFVDEYITDDSIDVNIPKAATIHTPTPQKANNYFLLIGDGMGEYQTKLFEYLDSTVSIYSDQEKAFHGYLLPNQGKINTNSLDGTTDSAAAATAMATGYRTGNGYVGKDRHGNDVKSLTELAVELGFKTAVMSTEVSTGATPSGFCAHAMKRTDIEGILASQALMTETDINCGLHELTWSELEKTVKIQIDKLENDKGTFIMYEEAYIDKYSHENNITDTFYIMLRFDQVIGVFMEYAFYNPDTMVIITADHETGGIEIGDDGKPHYTTGSHTSARVPIFAYGEGTEFFNGQEMRNNQIPKFIARMWGVDDFGAPEN